MDDMTDRQYMHLVKLIEHRFAHNSLEKLKDEFDQETLEKIKKVFEEVKEKADR